MYNTHQSFLVCASPQKAREETSKLAKLHKINLKDSPDVTIISSSGESISINEIRKIKKNISLKPLAADRKLIIIEGAQKLTHPAQNSLLKILEEPPPHALIVLEANGKENFLSTIISRVVVRNFSQKAEGNPQSLFRESLDFEKLLFKISEVQKPIDFLDNEITAIYNQTIANLKKDNISLKRFHKEVEELAQAKNMIASNVDPQFTLFNLAFKLKNL